MMNPMERQKRLEAATEQAAGKMYFDEEAVQLAMEKRAANRTKRMAEKLMLAKMAGNQTERMVTKF